MKKVHIYFTSLLALAAFTLGSCNKKPVEPVTSTENGLVLDFTGTFAGNPIEFNTGEYTKDDGEIMRFSNWGMILSKTSLIKTDGSEVMLGDGYLYINFTTDRTRFVFDKAPAGDYKGIKFTLGLDSATNHGDPTIWAADHPLNGNLSGLHWGWAGGYIFQALDGNWKKDANALAKGFSFHTATMSMVRNFTMNYNFSIEANKQKTANIEFKADEYFKTPNTISLANGAVSHSAGGAEVSLMNKILENAADVYMIKEVK